MDGSKSKNEGIMHALYKAQHKESTFLHVREEWVQEVHKLRTLSKFGLLEKLWCQRGEEKGSMSCTST